ncbi:hypothetical protein ISG25_37725, partial [Burkholderia pseudomallei]|nr:hypothetical protein [Burkholderia pseudomallei]MBF3851191.1 hypothetical protein [Burkholderia pseudomallei]
RSFHCSCRRRCASLETQRREAAEARQAETAARLALLQIASIRLGERLRYAIDVPAPLRELAFSPLLLQPL